MAAVDQKQRERVRRRMPVREVAALASGICAAFALVLAAAALLGWLVDLSFLTSFGLGTARTAVSTAMSILLTATAVLLRSRVDRHPALRLLSWLMLGTATAMSAFVVGRYLAGHPHPGRYFLLGGGEMSAATAICILLLCCGLLLTEAKRYSAGAAICTLGLVICEAAIIGILFDVEDFERVFIFSAMALPTAVELSLMFTAVLLMEHQRNWVRYFTVGGRSAAAISLLLPGAILVPICLGAVVLSAVEGGQFADTFGLALVVVGTTTILAIIVVIVAGWLERADRDRATLVAIIECSDDAIIGKSLDGVVTSWNPAAERLFGYSASEVIGRPIFAVIPEEETQRERDMLARLRRGEHVDHFDAVRLRKDGGRFDASVSVSPIELVSGEIVGLASIVRDNSETRRRDEELRRSNAELEQFAYVASHDLQEPLRMVANYVELLSDRYEGELDERAQKYIHFASDGARRMQRLVSDLLAYSRVGSQARAFAEVDTRRIVDTVIGSLGEQVEASGAAFEIDALPVLEGDEVQLTQLFQNLISNAIKFRSEAPPRIGIRAEQRGAQWLFAVTDNGVGIEGRFTDRIFKMFQRLHERGRYEGSGIGLSIAKRIVERHGGLIWVESQPGAGSTFYFTLNARAGPSAAAA